MKEAQASIYLGQLNLSRDGTNVFKVSKSLAGSNRPWSIVFATTTPPDVLISILVRNDGKSAIAAGGQLVTGNRVVVEPGSSKGIFSGKFLEIAKNERQCLLSLPSEVSCSFVIVIQGAKTNTSPVGVYLERFDVVP